MRHYLRWQSERWPPSPSKRSISKWAMADVFAAGIFIAFLAGNAMDNLDAKIQPGLYYFVSYCLVSNLAFQFRPPS